MTMQPKLQAFAYASAATLFWAGNAVVGKMLSDTVPPFSLNFLRWSLAFIILLPFVWNSVRRDWPVLKQKTRIISLLAFLSISSYNALQYLALQDTSPGNVGILTATMPMFILFISRVFLMEPVNGFDVTGIVFAFSGVCVLVLFGESNVAQVNQGDLVMILAVFAFAWYSVLLKGAGDQVSTSSLLVYMIGLGVLFSMPLFVWELMTTPEIDWYQSRVMLSLGYIAVFPALASYFCWNLAVKKGGARVTGLSINLLPIFALLLSGLFLNTEINAVQILSIAAIFLGTAISIHSHWKTAN